ncbi:unnamed protein product [Brassica rapa subsp. trilocularis]
MRSLPPLAPCDRRRLSLNGNSELVVFRPKVDEITLLTINTASSSSNFDLLLIGSEFICPD